MRGGARRSGSRWPRHPLREQPRTLSSKNGDAPVMFAGAFLLVAIAQTTKAAWLISVLLPLAGGGFGHPLIR